MCVQDLSALPDDSALHPGQVVHVSVFIVLHVVYIDDHAVGQYLLMFPL